MEADRSEPLIRAQACGLSDFTAEEREVVEILVDLGRLILPDRLPLWGWGSKRRRSALRSGPPLSPAVAPLPPPPPPPKLPPDAHSIDGDGSPCPQPKGHASSPDTPLSFSPSESDGKLKHKHTKRKATKRKREDWLKLVELLKEQGEALRREVENVRRYRDEVKALNVRLKAKKKELMLKAKNEMPGGPVTPVEEKEEEEEGEGDGSYTSLGVPATAAAPRTPRPPPTHHLPRPVPDRKPEEAWPSPSDVGSRKLPDLNLELAPLDGVVIEGQWNRARAAQARQRRIQIYRAKNTSAAAKPRVAFR